MSDPWAGMSLWERVAETMRATRGALDSDVDNVMDVFADWLRSDEVREVVAAPHEHIAGIAVCDPLRCPHHIEARRCIDALVAQILGTEGGA